MVEQQYGDHAGSNAHQMRFMQKLNQQEDSQTKNMQNLPQQ